MDIKTKIIIFSWKNYNKIPQLKSRVQKSEENNNTWVKKWVSKPKTSYNNYLIININNQV